MIWPSGIKYEGYFKNGLLHGNGLLTLGDGSLYNG